MDSLPVCLVTGATGSIGPRVVNTLSQRYAIRTLTRRAPTPGLFGTPVTAITGDVADGDVVRQAVRGADVVVHLASLLHIVNPSTQLRSEYERTNVEGTANVVAAARREGISRVVVISSIAVYGKGEHTLVDEDAPTRPDTVYGKTKLAAERRALEVRREDRAPLCTVLRSAAVYGPRVQGNYRRLVHALAQRRFVQIGRGENRRTLIFDADLASAIALAAVHPAAAGRVFNVSDGATHTVREIIDVICTALGRRPPRWHVPVTPIRAALRVTAALDRSQRLPIGPATLDKYLEDCAVGATRIQRDLGYTPCFGLERGWRQTVEEMRRGGELADAPARPPQRAA